MARSKTIIADVLRLRSSRLRLGISAGLMSALASAAIAQSSNNTPAPVAAGAPASATAGANQAYMIPMGGITPAPQSPPPPPPPPATSTPSAARAPPQGPAPVMMRAEQCLRDKVAGVSRIEPSPKLAVDMLLTDICAVEIDAASLFARNKSALARFNAVSERGRAGLPGPTVDPETGDIVSGPNVDSSVAQEVADRSSLTIAPALRALAAALVLAEKQHGPGGSETVR